MKENREALTDTVFEAIDTSNLSEYQTLILPQVYELLSCGEGRPTEEHLCIGARVAGKAAGAVVVELEEETGDLVLLSLYVASPYRRKGLGLTLLQRVLLVARQTFVFFEDQDEMIQFKTTYALPEALCETFREFLMAAGFTDFIKLPRMFAVDDAALRASRTFAPAFARQQELPAPFRQVSDLPEEEQQELYEAALGAYTPWFSVVSGSADARETIVLIDQIDPDNYRIILAERAPVTGIRQLVEALCAALSLIAGETEQFTVFAEERGESTAALFEQLAGENNTYQQEQAWMDVVFVK